MTKQIPPKERYSLRVWRGDAPIGEYHFNATPAGLEQLQAAIKPEFQYDILSRDGIIIERLLPKGA